MTYVSDSPEPTDGPPPPGVPERPDLVDAVLAALHKTGHAWLRRAIVLSSYGVIVLRGTVPSYYLKQLAQVTVMTVPGVESVKNELEVGLPDRPTGPNGETGGNGP